MLESAADPRQHHQSDRQRSEARELCLLNPPDGFDGKQQRAAD